MNEAKKENLYFINDTEENIIFASHWCKFYHAFICVRKNFNIDINL